MTEEMDDGEDVHDGNTCKQCLHFPFASWHTPDFKLEGLWAVLQCWLANSGYNLMWMRENTGEGQHRWETTSWLSDRTASCAGAYREVLISVQIANTDEGQHGE